MSKYPRTGRSSQRAIRLRKDLTPSELTIWQLIRRSKLGIRFRRQEPIGPYIVDFVALRHKIIVEADGSQHDWSDHDMRRDTYLRRLGFQVLRFENRDIARHPEWVIDEIRTAISPPFGGKVPPA